MLRDLAQRLVIAEYGVDAVATFRGKAAFTDRGGMFGPRRFMDRLGSDSRYSANSLDAVANVAVSALMSSRPDFATFPVMDCDRATLTLLIGTNPVISHGHDFGYADPVRRLRRLRERGEVWFIDPRRTEAARLADRHIAPRPGSDYAVLAYLVRQLLRQGSDEAYLDAHAINVDSLRRAGPSSPSLRQSSRPMRASRNSTSWCPRSDAISRLPAKSVTGVSMSASPCVPEWLLWSSHVVTGSFERPGGLWFNPDFFVRSDRRPRQGKGGPLTYAGGGPAGRMRRRVPSWRAGRGERPSPLCWTRSIRATCGR